MNILHGKRIVGTGSSRGVHETVRPQASSRIMACP
jgi:hypothetical protein